MTTPNTYPLKKAVTLSIIASVVLTGLILLASTTLGDVRATLLPDTGAAWYYWKLPQIELWPTVSVWVLYIAHQVIVWALIAKLSRQKYAPKGQISSLNIALLLVNGVFIILHIAQTMLFYEGLAQFVPVMSSQGSVIVMLVLVLIMMNRKRGLFFGKEVKLPQKGVAVAHQIHSYFIAWALVYTFWFHPTEGTLGHLMGFFYIFLLMIQMSLAKTQLHNNRVWITLLEVYVAVHGSIVAVGQQNGMWPMFLFGFLTMFIVTELYGLTKKKPTILLVSGIYALIAVVVYSGILGNSHALSDLHQLTWIPVILYGLVFVLVYVFQAYAVIRDRVKKQQADETA